MTNKRRTARHWLHGASALAVVTSVLVVIAPATVAGAAGEGAGPTAVPPPTSAPLAHPAPPMPPGSAPHEKPDPTSPRVRQLTTEDTATTDVWQQADGAVQVQLHSTPVNYQPPGQATFVPIVTTLEPDSSRPGRWQSTANTWTAGFGASGTQTAPVSVGGLAATLGFNPVGAAAVTPSITGSSATYTGLWPDVNATYQVTTTGVTENLALTSAGAPASFAFALTPGVTAEAGTTGGLTLVASGQQLATVPPLTVTTAQGTVVPPATSGASQEAIAGATGGSGTAISIAVNPQWLAGLPSAAFPLTIDPTVTLFLSHPAGYTVTTANGINDHHVETGRTGGQNPKTYRGVVQFTLSPYLDQSPPWAVVGATLDLFAGGGHTTATTPTSVYLDATEPTTFSAVAAGTELARGSGTSFTRVSLTLGDRTSAFAQIFKDGSSANPYFGLKGTESGSATSKIYGTSTLDVSDATLVMDLVQAPAATSVSSPANGSVIPTTTPTLKAPAVTTCHTNGAGHQTCTTIYYDFQVSTSPESTAGQVIESGWVKATRTATPTWPVPAGSLVDGTTYYVRVLTDVFDGFAEPRPPSSVNQFKVTLHLGSGGPSPTDTVGAAPGATTTPAAGAPSPGISPAGVTVNLVTGDLAFSASTHQMSSLSGSVGLSLSYNSLEANENGLEAQYFKTVNGEHDFSSTDTLVGQQLDPTVDDHWTPVYPPVQGLDDGPYLAKWTGEITVPTAGDWQFGVVAKGGGMRVYEGSSNTLVENDWSGGDTTLTPTYGTTVTLGSGSHAITVEAWGTASGGVDQLWMKDVGAEGEPTSLVPSDWLTPSAQTLPAGWSLSASNLTNGWTKLHDLGNEVVLQQADGDTAAFTSTSQDHYAPPPGETSLLLTVDAAGQFQLSTPTDQLYTFTASGTVTSVTTVATDRHPAALRYTYSGSDLALTKITDPVSTRSITLMYGPTSTCPSTMQAPPGMLCQIHFWDGTTSTLKYNSSGQLAELVNPGPTVSLFGYTATGRIDAIIDPLSFSAILGGKESDCPISGPTTDCQTQITYTAGKVATVTQPAPSPGAARPERTYHYTGTTRTASVTIAGFTRTAETVKYDDQGRITAQTTAAGLTTETVWNDVTEPIATITAKGEETASVYDLDGEVTDAYGPAPVACFTATSHLPVTTPVGTSGCGVAVPHTHTGYDQGITGLAAAYWTNGTLAGAPSLHGTIASADQTWSSPPVTGAHWSARLTGTIDLDAAGTWTLGAETTQTVSVYVSGQPITAATHGSGGPGTWSSSFSTGSVDVTTPGVYPIEVDFTGSGTTANGFDLRYTAPSGSPAQIPTTALDPNYGLKTSTTTPDGDITDYGYTSPATGIGPQYGLVTATTEDPSGLDLVTKTTYEAPSTTTYLRKLSTALPDGETTTDRYYSGTAGPIAAVCGVGSTTPQGGQLKSQTGPTPGTSGKARIQEFVYDTQGQQVGVRVGDNADITSAGWQCTHYDALDRMTSQSWPAANTSPARTVTYTYSVGGNPLVTSVETGSTATTEVTTTVDLEGRVVDYTSAGKTTTTTYDQAGQVTETTGPGGTVRDGYDTAGQLHSIDIDGSFGGGSAYWCGPAGLEFGCLPGTMTGVTYPGFISVTYSYDAYGEMDTVAYGETTGGTLFAGDRVTYSPGGRKLTDESVPGLFHTYTNPNPTGGTDFSYDGAGRLIQAYEPGKVIDYSYANSSPTEDCPVPDAGENTDLTSVTTYPSSGGTATTRYCYDGADQITKTATSGTATTAKSGTSTTYAFDAEGFQTQNKGTSYTWTASGQMASATSGDTMVTYTYDALDRLIARTKGTTTTRYAYCGFTTSPCAVLSATGAVDQQVVSGIGGVLVTVKPGNNSPTYSFANLAGNYIFSKRLYGTWSPTVTYSPYGAVSTRTGASHNGLSGGLSEGAFGTAGKLTDRTLTTTLVFMGARVYSPTEGRFLSVDPIEGGCANAYVYVRGDPVNSSDLDGQGTCIPEFTGSFPVTASTGGTRSVCGYTASVKSTGRTSVVEIGSANPVETAQQCFTNLGTENMQCSTVEGGSGPAAVCHGTGTLGTGTYTYRSHGSKTTYPVINVHVGSSTLTIHFTYVASSPCRGPTQDA